MKPKIKKLSRVAHLLHRFVRRFFPEIAMTRQESMEALRHLNLKLQEAKSETQHWRERTFKVEAAFERSVKFIRTEAQECEGVGWRLY